MHSTISYLIIWSDADYGTNPKTNFIVADLRYEIMIDPS
jgi:hypothetical protein